MCYTNVYRVDMQEASLLVVNRKNESNGVVDEKANTT